MKFELKYKPFGERTILIEWPQKIDKNILFDVLDHKNKLQKYYNKQKVQINSAYCSITISYNHTINNIYDEISTLKTLYSKQVQAKKQTFIKWHIPVCYDPVFALDLEEISGENKLSNTEIIKRHYEAIYTIYFIGFLPGFLYLGGLDEQLYVARRSQPRLNLLKGAVGIGGYQTGIYPHNGPGGWNIIGNSPINLFKATNRPPCFAQAGDSLKFYEISIDEHKQIQELDATGYYKIESEVMDD